jgi:hypothetical protein
MSPIEELTGLKCLWFSPHVRFGILRVCCLYEALRNAVINTVESNKL